MKTYRIKWLHKGLPVLACLVVAISVSLLFTPSNGYALYNENEENGPSSVEGIGRPTPSAQNEGTQSKPQYVPREVLIKLKEGVEPQSVAKAVGLDVKGLARVHSITSAVAKFKRECGFKKDKKEYYLFKGKEYKDLAHISDNELFKEAYVHMPPKRQVLYRKYKISLPKDVTVEEALDRLRKNPNVEDAQPNYLIELQYTPNDPYFTEQDNLAMINAPEAWDISDGSPDIVIAVIDTGIDYNHPDLFDNIWVNPDIVSDRNGDGHIDTQDLDLNGNRTIDVSELNQYGTGQDVIGYNFASNPGPDNNPTDLKGHGTHCAGIAAAVTNNGIGIAGVAPKCKIMPLCARYGTGVSILAAAQGLLYAVDNGADVISMSFGAYLTPSYAPSWSLKDEIELAYSEGIVLVAASGNVSTSSRFYPAAYDEVIAVAGYNYPASTYGLWVDVSAPASAWSTSPENTYKRVGATSIACPHVSGVAALILSASPGRFSNRQVRNIIKVSSDPVESVHYIGQGRVNAYGAAATTSMPLDAAITTGGDIQGMTNIVGTAAWGDTGSYSLYYGEGREPSSWVEIYTSSSMVDNGILSADFDTREFENGPAILRLLVEDSEGRILEESSEILILNNPLTFPMNNDILNPGGIIDIEGTLWPDTIGYTIEYGVGFEPDVWYTEGITITGALDGVLARWDTSAITQCGFYNFKITVELPFGMREYYVRMFYFDTRLKEGWPQYSSINTQYDNSGQTATVVDLNGDGYKELITGKEWISEQEPAQLLVYEDTGALLWSKVLDSNNAGVSAPTVGNLDYDAYLEILIDEKTDSGCKILALNHDGSEVAGNWPVAMPPCRHWYKVIADLDNDGDNEVIARSYQKVLIGTEWKEFLVILDSAGGIITEVEVPTTLTGSGFPAVGNFDDDADLEIVTHSGIGGFDILNIDGSSVLVQPILSGAGSIKSFAIGDVNNDGDEDIVLSAQPNFGQSDGGVFIYDRYGNVLPGNWPVLNEGAGAPSVADFDNDGDYEICVTHGKNIYVYHHDGYLASGWPQQVNTFNQPLGSTVAIGDINGDGYLDVISYAGGILWSAVLEGVFDNCGGVWAWNFDGTLIDLNPEPGVYTIFGDWSSAYPLTISDTDNNGRLEIIGSTAENYGWGEVKTIHKNRDTLYVWGLDTPYSALNIPWPMANHDPQRTGRYIPAAAIPNAPSELIAMAVSESRINLSWKDNSDCEDGFVIERSVDGSHYEPLVMLGDNIKEYTDTDLENETTYYYRVRAYNTLGESENSNTASATTSRPPYFDPPLEDKTTDEGQLLEFVISAVDPDGDNVIFPSPADLPQGAQFLDNNDNTATFSWSLAYTDHGVYTVTFIATDTKATCINPVMITVHDVNGPPSFDNPIEDKTVRMGETLQFTISATDPEGDPLVYWMIFYNNEIDIDEDDDVDMGDCLIIMNIMGTHQGEPGFIPKADLNSNRAIDTGDLGIFISRKDIWPNGVCFDNSAGNFLWTPDFDETRIYKVTFSAIDITEPYPYNSETITINVNPTLTDAQILRNIEAEIRENQCMMLWLLRLLGWEDRYEPNFDLNDDTRIDATDQILVRNIHILPEDQFTLAYTKLMAAVEERLGLTSSDENFISAFDTDLDGDIDSSDYDRIHNVLMGTRTLASGDAATADVVVEDVSTEDEAAEETDAVEKAADDYVFDQVDEGTNDYVEDYTDITSQQLYMPIAPQVSDNQSSPKNKEGTSEIKIYQLPHVYNGGVSTHQVALPVLTTTKPYIKSIKQKKGMRGKYNIQIKGKDFGPEGFSSKVILYNEEEEEEKEGIEVHIKRWKDNKIECETELDPGEYKVEVVTKSGETANHSFKLRIE